MPYELGTIWNVTSKYIYNTLDKNIGIGTTTPICELDVYCNIAENGIKLEDKYQLKPEHNKKYDLIVREDLDEDHQHLIIWYKFNKDDFTSNFTNNNDTVGQQYGELSNERGTISNLQKEYYVGTGSAEINDELYYKIEMTNNQFNSGEYTFCFWLFLNEECDNYKYILNLQDKGSSTESDIFYLKYFTGKLKIYKDPNNYIEYNYTLDINKWHHITIIINDPASLDILIDGILIDDIYTSQQTNGFLRNGSEERKKSANIYLGNISNSINGYIDDFRIYKTNLQINYIQNNIIGKITKITPGNISANGNYGIDIVNYSNNVNIGGTGPNDNVNLRVFGNLKVDGDLSISELDIVTAEFITLNVTSNLTVGSNVDIDNYLTVSKTITENQRTLAQKYASISQIDKHTDVIISKMTDKEDVRTLYSTMPEFFQSNLILAYDFDFNIDDIDNSNDFFSNNVLQLNSNTAPIYSTFSGYNIDPNKSKNAIDYYGTKYVKGNSSLHCGSNIFNSDGIDYYKFNTLDTNNAYLTSSKNYTISFWIRFNEIDRNQYIFNFGVPVNPVDTIEKSINISLNSSNNLNIEIVNEDRGASSAISNSIETFKFKKDEWYHIVLILKNGIDISIPTDINTDSNLLIQYFSDLGYTNNTSPTPTYFDFATATNIATIFTYVNGIELDSNMYDRGVSIFGNTPTDFINYFGVLDESTTTDYLNGYIDDFKMYQTVVPINYINEYIIGDALIIKPGLLSAIGNYGINIKNFTNIVSVGNCNNDVDLHIYGLLKIEDTKLTISNCDIDNLNGILTTSNFEILETLDVSNISVSNIEIYDLISGPDFHLGSSNFINNIEIDHLSNINLNSCNITADTITVTNELILGDAILSNIKIYGINIDDTFSISNNNITILRDLTIGDTNCNAYRYDLGTVNSGARRRITDDDSNFSDYNGTYDPDFTTITDTDDIQIFDKSIIFYGNTEQQNYDIQFKNNYIRNEYCNIKEEIEKSYGYDRDRTRIKLDVGNIKLENGFIQLIQKDILEDNEPSTLKIEENQISITSNHNTTILSDSLILSNANDDCSCLLTNSNFMFNNDNGFTNNETLKIKTIVITDEIEIQKINTLNTSPDTISINTSNADNPYGKIQGFLCSNSKIDIQYEIKTNSNIECAELNTPIANVSNIICDYEIGFTPDTSSNTTISRDRINVNTLHIYGSIILGDQVSGENDNSINGGFGSLSIKTINTTNPDSNALSIDTLYDTNLGKIRGFLSSNSKIEIDDEIRTNSNIYCIDLECSNINVSNLESSNINVDNLYSSNINVSNITVKEQLNVYNIIASNINVDNLYSSNINTSNITVEDQLNVYNIIASNINVSNLESSNINVDNLYSSNINVSNITVKEQLNVYNIIASNINVDNLYSSNINTSNITVEDQLNVYNIIASNINVSNLESSNINTSNITVEDQLNVNNIIASNIDCIDTIESFNIISSNVTVNNTLSVNDIAVSDTVRAVTIRGYDTEHCEILGILSNNSYIDISGEIKTTSNIYASNIITDTLEICNILNNNSYGGYFIVSSNSGILVNNIKTTTSLAAYSIDTLVGDSLGRIRGKLAGDSEINIIGKITTTSNISGDILEINTITGASDFTSININNEINFNCNITNDVTIYDKKFEIIKTITGRADSSSQIQLIGNRIKSFGDTDGDRNIYMEFYYNGLRRVEDGNTCNIISYDTGIDGIVLNCKQLVVENFDPGDGSQFKFPNIISFSRNTTASIPNVYIGYNTDSINLNTNKDVLYIDTETDNDTDKRLSVGNILVRNRIEISHNRDDPASKLLRITTMETVESSGYAFFINQNGDEMLTIDLNSGGIGINTRPLANDEQIKLFVNGGIKSSGDIIGFANVSDKRFKTDIRSFDTNDIEIVNKLNPVKFKWKEDLFNSNMANKNDIGFIAQEVKELIPEAVSTFKIEMDDIDYNYIKYERMIPYLINNIKYLNNKIVELENKLNGI